MAHTHAHIYIYIPNPLHEFGGFLFLLDQLPYQGQRFQSDLLYAHSWSENSWIQTFSVVITAM